MAARRKCAKKKRGAGTHKRRKSTCKRKKRCGRRKKNKQGGSIRCRLKSWLYYPLLKMYTKTPKWHLSNIYNDCKKEGMKSNNNNNNTFQTPGPDNNDVVWAN